MAKPDEHEIWKSYFKRLQAFLREAGTGGELTAVNTGMPDLDQWLQAQLQLQVDGKLRSAHQRLLGQLGKLPDRTPLSPPAAPTPEPDYSAYFLEDEEDRPRPRGRPRKTPGPGAPRVLSSISPYLPPSPGGAPLPPIRARRGRPPKVPVLSAPEKDSPTVEYQLNQEERWLVLCELLPWLSTERQLPAPFLCQLELAHWKLPEIIQQAPLPWPYASEPKLTHRFSELRQSGELRQWQAFTLVRLQVPLEEAPLWTADWELALLQAARELKQAGDSDFWQRLLRKHSPTANWWRESKKKARRGELDSLQEAWLRHLGAPVEVRRKQKRPPAEKRGRRLPFHKVDQLLPRIREFYAANPPDALPNGDKPLVNFIHRVRYAWKKNRLDAAVQSSLEAAGLVFDLDKVPNRFWLVNYEKLAAFHARFGHCRPPTLYPEAPKLPNWVYRQRIRRQKKTILSAEIALLDRLGFDWQTGTPPVKLMAWHRKLALLKNVLQEKGLTTLPKFDSDLGPTWMRWLNVCRRYRRQNRLPADLVTMLDQLGIRWTIAERIGYRRPKSAEKGENYTTTQRERWLQWFERWKAWKLSDPRGYGGERTLPRWCVKQRVRRKRGVLPQEFIRLLDEQGFNWDPYEQPREPWLVHYRFLANFIRQHGHMIIKRDGIPEDPGLGEWIAQVRRRRKMGRLSAEHIRLLDEIGFAWEGPDPQASRRFGRPYLEAAPNNPPTGEV